MRCLFHQPNRTRGSAVCRKRLKRMLGLRCRLAASACLRCGIISSWLTKYVASPQVQRVFRSNSMAGLMMRKKVKRTGCLLMSP